MEGAGRECGKYSIGVAFATVGDGFYAQIRVVFALFWMRDTLPCVREYAAMNKQIEVTKR
ncbi:hypothetical protein [Thermosporothrix hazakensis]|uniref:hypothetical protein n=1 Tax=Thermosporothrix hazakensis TaxID=644383 RepID=UPI0010D831A8|nr:hypothetical protein [Thermosporothrix hazakensis]GCE49665.1 hypothetical protein KTH_45340 [Thermosporothrix hazakensis]